MQEKYGFIGTLGEIGNVSIGYSTGVAKLDRALQVGGIPGGRITELVGPESSGKTTLVGSVIARLHENTDELALYIDPENALEASYFLSMGVDPNRLIIMSPEVGEDTFDVAEAGIRSGEFAIVAVDSIPAVSPKREMDGEIGDSHVGLVPRLVSQFLRKTAFAVRESGVAVIFVNQLRDRIARIPLPPESPGGRALKHHASVRLFLKNAGPLTNGTDAYGSKIEFTIKKSKVGGQYSIGAFEIWNDRGVCQQANLLDEAVERGVISQKGAWFRYGDWAAQGRYAAITALEDRELFRTILEEVRNGKATNGH